MTRASFSLDMHVQLQIIGGLHDHNMQQFTHSVGVWPGQHTQVDVPCMCTNDKQIKGNCI